MNPYQKGYPELPSADGDYTPAQRKVVDARLAEARNGAYHGPFDSADDAIRFLRSEIRTRKLRVPHD